MRACPDCKPREAAASNTLGNDSESTVLRIGGALWLLMWVTHAHLSKVCPSSHAQSSWHVSDAMSRGNWHLLPQAFEAILAKDRNNRLG